MIRCTFHSGHPLLCVNENSTEPIIDILFTIISFILTTNIANCPEYWLSYHAHILHAPYCWTYLLSRVLTYFLHSYPSFFLLLNLPIVPSTDLVFTILSLIFLTAETTACAKYWLSHHNHISCFLLLTAEPTDCAEYCDRERENCHGDLTDARGLWGVDRQWGDFGKRHS